MKCNCGCGKDTNGKAQYIHGHNMKTKEAREAAKKRMCGKTIDEMYGKEKAEKIREAHRKRFVENNPMDKQESRKKHKEKISSKDFQKRRIASVKKYYKENPERAEEVKKIRADALRKISTRNSKHTKGKKYEDIMKDSESVKDRKKKIRIARVNQSMPQNKIEKIMDSMLVKFGVKFERFHNIANRYQSDFFIPTINTLIECDGDYWHNYPDGTRNDEIKDRFCIEKGYKIVHFWEKDIKKNPSAVIDRIKSLLEDSI